MAQLLGTVDEELEERITNENYKIWKKNVPFLYDVMITHALEWPSLTVQWLPDTIVNTAKEQKEGRLILGTHTSESDNNYLMIAKVTCPMGEDDPELRKYNEETGEAGGYGQNQAKIEVSQRINHDGEINRARYMPQNPCLIACKGPKPDVLVFDYTKHPSQPSHDGTVKADLRLGGHDSEGYGLSWNPSRPGLLLSGSNDCNVCIWDVSAKCTDKNSVLPLSRSKAHHGAVEDVAWSVFEPKVFATVGDDKMLQIIKAHEHEVNCLSFNPLVPHLLLTGSADKTVGVWDIRNLSKVLYSFQHHQDSVMQVQWSPKRPEILASASQDKRICVWDMARVGQFQTKECAEDGPAELLFIHAGHTGRVSDLCWDPNNAWTIASVAEDNILHIWEMVGKYC
ncbi:hypothetical protein GUITHDRAFT_158785 [Guillardia theta CCMP2712]|uniref:Histone-binding protein RBBP4-like N-terminal domain-containing protein n=1 Tax=Guillardia theta (strain CCMP2712) TaxID=905079 RepID=L1IEZ0_GUITC|nr:hypothetical protein GUITHDRAFT_158785 [Guillardia theta CCMP2712]EKX34778.1 hypothetical protein GUITHDRAFT_158785 [Guillardia theta CCMP2712]|eukprot:XP_005821758.1 hypothetical protein GUITHDRAFT_158785 [Guillardia theta CCMP2712]